MKIPLIGEKRSGCARSFRQITTLLSKDMTDVLRWKFAEMPGRLKREINLLSTVSPSTVVAATSSAFADVTDVQRLRFLRRVKGVGVAVGSVVLTFYDPTRFGIIDIHSWRELFGKEQGTSFGESDFVLFTNAVRAIAKEHHLTPRDVEKALFRRNRVAGLGD